MQRAIFEHTIQFTSPPPILAAAGNKHDYFGWSIGMSGEYAIVGARDADSEGIKNCGAVYVYRYDGKSWIEQSRLISQDTASSFGTCVAIDGTTVVVGAYSLEGKGAVFVYTLDNSSWILQTKLVASDASPRDQFGYSVSICKDEILVGARSCDHKGEDLINSGAAYVFSRQNDGVWRETAKLSAALPRAGGQFGYSVSLQAGCAIVGAPTTLGSAHIFTKETSVWKETSVLASPCGASDQFGFDVSLSENGKCAVVSAPKWSQTSPLVPNCGAVYIYMQGDDSIWVQKAQLKDSMPTNGEGFGNSVSLSGRHLVVGGYKWTRNSELSQCGTACIFVLDGATQMWSTFYRYVASDAHAKDYLGYSVATDGKQILASARNWPTQKSAAVGCVYSTNVPQLNNQLPTLVLLPGTVKRKAGLGYICASSVDADFSTYVCSWTCSAGASTITDNTLGAKERLLPGEYTVTIKSIFGSEVSHTFVVVRNHGQNT